MDKRRLFSVSHSTQTKEATVRLHKLLVRLDYDDRYGFAHLAIDPEVRAAGLSLEEAINKLMHRVDRAPFYKKIVWRIRQFFYDRKAKANG